MSELTGKARPDPSLIPPYAQDILGLKLARVMSELCRDRKAWRKIRKRARENRMQRRSTE